MDKEKEIARLKDDFSEKLNERWKELKALKGEYQRENENLRKQLEIQITDNAKLKVQIIDYTKTLEGLQKKDQTITVLKKLLVLIHRT